MEEMGFTSFQITRIMFEMQWLRQTWKIEDLFRERIKNDNTIKKQNNIEFKHNLWKYIWVVDQISLWLLKLAQQPFLETDTTNLSRVWLQICWQ